MDKKEAKNIMIFGTRAIIEGVKAGKDIDKVFLKKGGNNELLNELINHLREREIPFQFVPEQKLNRITRKNHQGAIALISPISFQKVEDIIPQIYEKGEMPFFILLDGVSDVRNFGAIARTAECAGVHALIIPSKGSAQINADAMKTSAGALHSLPVCRENSLVKTVELLQNSGIKVVAATEKTQNSLFNSDLNGPVCIVMGAEDTGISNDIIKHADILAQLPIKGKIESLNVSVATGVFIYEAVRQRGIG